MNPSHHLRWLLVGLGIVLILLLANAVLLAPVVNQSDLKGAIAAITGLSLILLIAVAIGLAAFLRAIAPPQSQPQTQNPPLTSAPEHPKPTLGGLKLEFFTILSHEFRTPLSAILISSQLLDSPKAQASVAKRQRNLKRIQSAVKSLNQLLADLLLLARAEAGQLELKPYPIELTSFCRELLTDVQQDMTQPHDLVLKLTGDRPDAYLDATILRSLLLGLLQNAIQYSPPESRVTLRVVSDAEQTRFQIADHGIGIPIAEQAQVFELFQRGQNVQGIPGSGLGLTVAQTCVALHGGAIAIESQPDAGTTVTVDLPWCSRQQLSNSKVFEHDSDSD